MLYNETMLISKQNALQFLKISYGLVYDIESLILRVKKFFIFEKKFN